MREGECFPIGGVFRRQRTRTDRWTKYDNASHWGISTPVGSSLMNCWNQEIGNSRLVKKKNRKKIWISTRRKELKLRGRARVPWRNVNATVRPGGKRFGERLVYQRHHAADIDNYSVRNRRVLLGWEVVDDVGGLVVYTHIFPPTASIVVVTAPVAAPCCLCPLNSRETPEFVYQILFYLKTKVLYGAFFFFLRISKPSMCSRLKSLTSIDVPNRFDDEPMPSHKQANTRTNPGLKKGVYIH